MSYMYYTSDLTFVEGLFTNNEAIVKKIEFINYLHTQCTILRVKEKFFILKNHYVICEQPLLTLSHHSHSKP